VQRIVHRYDPPERFVAGTVGEPGARTFFLQARSGRRVTSVALEKEQVAVLAGRVEQILTEAAETSPNVAAAISGPSTQDAAPLDSPITEDFRVGTLVLAWQQSQTVDEPRLVIQAYAVTDAPAVEVGADAPDGPSDEELAALEAEVAAMRAEVAAEGLVTEEVVAADLEADADAYADSNSDGDDDEDDPVVDLLEPTEEDSDALVVRLDPVAASAFARRCAAVVSAGRPPCPFCGRPLDPAGHLCPRANGYRPARS